MPCRALVYLFVSAISLSAWGADANLTTSSLPDRDNRPKSGLCEQLLNAGLSGHYVVRQLKSGHAALVELRPLGDFGAYAVHTARMNLPAQGLRELEFERTAQGWRLQDGVERRVNVVSGARTDGDLNLNFEDTADIGARASIATPIQGDASAWTVHFADPGIGDVRFTHIRLDRAFEKMTGQSVKSLLATRTHSEDPGTADYVFFVEFNRPLTTTEACRLLDNEGACPLEAEVPGPQRSYRFGVALSVYEFLEVAGPWSSHWEVQRVDVVPAKTLSVDYLRRLTERTKSARTTAALDEDELAAGLSGALDEMSLDLGGQQRPASSGAPAASAPPARPLISRVTPQAPAQKSKADEGGDKDKK